ncbi:MAG: CHAT domain-containing protein, partial [Thermoanaerobaculia bacterium]|nr:CHAT domain-containing protein [Thermoanaerobaculia bacterium]
AAEAWRQLSNEVEVGRQDDAAWLALEELRARLADHDFEAATALVADPRWTRLPSSSRAMFLQSAGEVLFLAARYEDSLAVLEESLHLRQNDDPTSAATARSLREVSRVKMALRDSTGEENIDRVLDRYDTLPNVALQKARALSIKAGFAWHRQAFEDAESQYRKALDLSLAAAPNSPTLGALWFNLGLLAHQRGENDVAGDYYRRSLDYEENSDAGGRVTAYALNSLGLLAREIGDLERAMDYYQRALTIFRRISPEGIEVAGILNNLGRVYTGLGDLASAEECHREALELREAIRPDSLDVAASIHNLGIVARLRGNLPIARRQLERALELKKHLVPGSLLVATSLSELGEVARSEGRLADAEALHLAALELRQAIAPDLPVTADSFVALGDISYQRGRRDEAAERWSRALTILELHQSRLELTPEEEAGLAGSFQAYYRKYAALLAEDGRTREAFELLERSRARALRIQIERRNLSASNRVPAALRSEQRRLERKTDRAKAHISRLSPDADELELKRGELRELRLEQDDLAVRIRKAAPDIASLGTPDPVTVEQIRDALDPGTLLVEFAVGSSATQLFVVHPQGDGGSSVDWFSLPIGETELARRVDLYRALIARGRGDRGHSAVEAALLVQGARLFETLFGPILEEVDRAERVLIVAEGPLLVLPFAALVVDLPSVRYLGPSKPLHFSQSAGLYAQLLARRRDSGAESQTLTIFADPEYPESSALVRAHQLRPLPASRREAERIADQWPQPTTLYLGSEASEENVKSLAPIGVLHFATHALLDSRRPLESALALAMAPDVSSMHRSGGDDLPMAENGLLHAWEIIGSLDLAAELVVLSACDTGRGLEVRGEGLIGLARAFHHAGARSLLVSQWQVEDRLTGELMVDFYRHLGAGVTKDLALSRAQREFLSGSLGTEAQHPYHWAGFQLLGDWQ